MSFSDSGLLLIDENNIAAMLSTLIVPLNHDLNKITVYVLVI